LSNELASVRKLPNDLGSFVWRVFAQGVGGDDDYIDLTFREAMDDDLP
jgi:hypothetical protein